jgi:hypothetical protein
VKIAVLIVLSFSTITTLCQQIADGVPDDAEDRRHKIAALLIGDLINVALIAGVAVL